jgi:uncharacterized protein YcfL
MLGVNRTKTFLIFVLFLFSGCKKTSTIELNEINSQTVYYDETIHLNNCGGKAESEQSISRNFLSRTEGGIEFKLGYESVIEAAISAKYQKSRNIEKIQKLIAPPATNMEFLLKWSEELRSGIISYEDITGVYEVNIPIAVELVYSRDIGCSEPSSISDASSQVTLVPTQSSANINISKTEFLGEWLYQKTRAPMPNPAGLNQVIFAHGDINNSNTCHVKEFQSGELVQGLGLGSFKLWLITGPTDYIAEIETHLQNGAASHSGTDCPYLP